jgi:hypothetical protein
MQASSPCPRRRSRLASRPSRPAIVCDVRLGHEAYWSFNLYPEAGEGGGCFVPTLRPRPVNLGPAADPDLAEFFRGLRRELGAKPLPYAWAPEWHPGGHGLHVHFAVGRYVRQRLIAEVWGRGIGHIKLIEDLPVGFGALEEARVAAGYLAKYVSKSIGDERVPRLHRYEVAQGFQPEKVALRADSEQAVVAEASERMGARPARVGSD